MVYMRPAKRPHTSNMSTYKTSLAFARLPDTELSSFAGNVVTKLTDNEGYTSPLVTMAVLSAAQVEFANAIIAASHGGKLATADKDAKREALLLLLRQEAAYVQSISGEDLAMLLSSGYEAV